MAPADEPGAIFLDWSIRRGQARLVCDLCIPSKGTKVPATMGSRRAGFVHGLSMLSSVFLGVRLQVFAYLYAAEEIKITQRAQRASITFASLPN